MASIVNISQEAGLPKSRKHADRNTKKLSPVDSLQILQAALNQVGRAGLEPSALNAAIGKMPVLGITIKNAFMCNRCYNFNIGPAPEDLICGTCRATKTVNGAG